MTKYIDAGDIDLDEEVVLLADGTRLTESLAESLGEEIAERHFRGRPSLSGGSRHSPKLGVRVSDETHARLLERARSEGKTISQVARDAIERYV